MAKSSRELLVTLGADTTAFSQKIKRAKDLTKELDSNFKMLASSSKDYEKSVEGLGKKQEYLSDRILIANSASKAYTERMSEQKKILDTVSKECETYTRQQNALSVALNKAKENGLEGTNAFKKMSEALNEVSEKQEKYSKDVRTHTDRMIGLRKEYNANQASIQQMNRELTETEIRMSKMASNAKFDKMNEDLQENERRFNNLKNVTDGYGDTMRSLANTQTFYQGQMARTNDLMDAYSQEMSNSKKKINELEITVRSLNKSIKEQEQAMKNISESDPNFQRETEQLERLKYELSTSTKLLEEHTNEVKELDAKYKLTENSLSSMSSKLIKVNKDMDTLSKNLTFEKMNKEIKYLNDVTINNLSSKLRILKSDFERLDATTDNFDNSMQGLENKMRAYKDMLSNVKKSTKAYEGQIESLQGAIKETGSEISRVEKNLSRYEKQISDMDDSNEKWDEVANKVRQANEEHKQLTAELARLNGKLKQSEQGLEANNREFNSLNKNIRDAQGSVAKFRESFKFESIKRDVKSLAEQGFEQLNREIEQTNFKLTRLENETENLSASSMGLYQKLKLLRSAYSENEKLADAYGKELESNAKSIDKFTKKSQELENQLKDMAKALNSKSLKGEALEKQGEEFKKLEAKYKEVNSELDKHIQKQKQLESNVKQSRTALSSLTGTINKTSSQLKEMNRIDPFKKAEKSLSEMRLQYDLLSAKLENTQSKFLEFDKSIRGNIQANKILKQQTESLRKEYALQVQTLGKYENSLTQLKGKQKELTNEIKKTKMQLLQMDGSESNFIEINSGLNKMEMELKEVSQQIEKTTSKFKEMQLTALGTSTSINNSLRGQTGAWDALSSRLRSVGGSFVSMGNSMQSAGASLMPLTMAITALGGLTLKTGIEFQASMSKVASVSGATGDELDRLTVKAREMGKQTVWSATDASEAMNFMATAGWNTSQMLGGIEPMLHLASAGATDLAKTSDIVTSSMTSLGMTADKSIGGMIKNTERFTDVMAVTSAKSNTNIEMLGESFKYAGTVAGTYKISVEDLSLTMGLMANNGIRASQAGTSFRTGLTRLVAPTDKASAMLDKYNMNIVKNKDGSVDLRATIDKLREGFGKMKTETGEVDTAMQGMVADTIFGKTAMTGWLSVINSSEEDLNSLAKSIDNASGSAKLMAEEMTDNLKGDIENLKSVVEESMLTVFDSIEPVLRQMTQGIAKFIDNATSKFKELSPAMQRFVVMLTGASALLAPLTVVMGLLVASVGHIINAFGTLASVFGMMKGKLLLIQEGFNALVVSSGSMGKAILTLATRFAPLGIAVAGIGLVIKNMWSNAKSQTIEGMDSITDTMSMADKAMVEPFLKANQKINANLVILKSNSASITKSMRDEMTYNLGKVSDETTQMIQTISDKSEKVLSESLSHLTTLNEEQIEHLQSSVKKGLDKRTETVETAEKTINDITAKALEERRDLTDREVLEIEAQQKKINEISLSTMKFFSNDMENIQKTLNNNLGNLRKEDIANAIGTAKERKDEVVGQADKEYQELKTIYDLTADDLNIADRRKLKNAVESARQKKDQVVGQAEQEYAQTVSYARKSAGESVNSIDWATGELKSTWDIFWDNLGNGFEKFGYNLGLSFEKMDVFWSKVRYKMEIAGLHMEKFFNNGFMNPEKEKQLEDQIAKMEKGYDAMAKGADKVGEAIERIKGLSPELSVIAKDLNMALISGAGKSLQEFATMSEEEINKVLDNTSKLPLNVQADLLELNEQLVNNGVQGGIKQFVSFIGGNLDQVRLEFKDLSPEVQGALQVLTKAFEDSTNEVNGLSFQQFVINSKGDLDLVKENMASLPANIQNMIKQIDPTQWETLFKYFSETASTELDKTGKTIDEKGAENAEKQYKSGEKQGKSKAEGARSTIEENKQVGKEIDKALEGDVNGEEGNKKGSEFTSGVASGMQQNAGQVITQSNAIKKNLQFIDDIRLGNVTMQLSEVNKWLGRISGTSTTTTRNALVRLTNLPFGNTTKGLSEVNKWLMRTQNRAKDTRQPLMNLTNLPFGNTTKGLSEVNKWLMITTNRANDTARALRSITNVRFGGVTYGLSQIASWLDTVRRKSNSATGAINGMSFARPKTTGYQTGLAVERASIMAQTAMDVMTTGAGAINFANYKTSGGFYSPTEKAIPQSKSDSEISALKSVLQATLEQNNILMQMLSQERPITVGVNVDGRQIAKASARYMEGEINSINNRKSRLGGNI